MVLTHTSNEADALGIGCRHNVNLKLAMWLWDIDDVTTCIQVFDDIELVDTHALLDSERLRDGGCRHHQQ
ncbi:hypothetical protein A6K26_007870 [Gammaproteobacteria bacterium 2W06]|nr:hypothetical protein A6K26_007870 [Gammaproteobacteria bacterium 2W06]